MPKRCISYPDEHRARAAVRAARGNLAGVRARKQWATPMVTFRHRSSHTLNEYLRSSGTVRFAGAVAADLVPDIP